MPQSPTLAAGATPSVPITGVSIGVVPPSPLTSTDLQAIIDEMQAEIAAISSSITIQDEGTPLSTGATTLNFTGTGVTASGTGTTKTINIPGASSRTFAFFGG